MKLARNQIVFNNDVASTTVCMVISDDDVTPVRPLSIYFLRVDAVA